MKKEPALLMGVIAPILTVAASLNLPWLNAAQAAALVSVFAAVIVAFYTRPVAPALFTGLFSAVVAFGAQYGLHLSDATVGGVTALILGAFALFGIRPQVEPTTA